MIGNVGRVTDVSGKEQAGDGDFPVPGDHERTHAAKPLAPIRLTAAGLILSLGAAWWAAIKGGQHRDKSVPARFEFATRRRTSP